MHNAEFNYYWGDDSFHSGVRICVDHEVTASNLCALANQYKPVKASVAYVICYIDSLYVETLELY